jgi:uroporphyrinogen-III synthase
MILPTLLLTRPRDSAEAFVATLDPAARAAVDILIAPLLDIRTTGAWPDLEKNAAAIFTSANGVRFAPEGAGRQAYCVGAQTTHRAEARGWLATQAGETAYELMTLLKNMPPDAPLWHLGGEHTIGDIAETLTSAGVPTRHITLYHQHLLPLNPAARDALERPCIVPVFSPRSALHLVSEAKNLLSRAHIIALSESVAAAFAQETTAKCLVLPAPRAIYMRKAVENLCLTSSLP